MSLEDAAYDCRPVGFYARSRTLCPALSAKDILFEILLAEFQTSRNAVQNDSDEFPVGFSEDAYSEFSAYRVHIFEIYFFIVCCTYMLRLSFSSAVCRNISWNCGKDFATHSSSSISIAPSAPRAATFRAITIRWS